MTSATILSDNGASSGSAGLKTGGGNDGTLQIQTTTSGGTPTLAVNIDTNQNVMVGTTTNTNSSKLVATGVVESTTGGFRFPDGTVQTTRATSLPGIFGQVFTTNGTFTIPTGVTGIKVTVVGGGGGSSGVSGCIGYNGSSGGTSSVASGTQSISTISATGGGGNIYTGNAGASGGAGSGGDINFSGGVGAYGPYGASGGASSFAGGVSTNYVSPGGYGGGAGTNANGGGGGGTAIKYLSGLTPGNTLAVTIGGGGSGLTSGKAGIVVFEW